MTKLKPLLGKWIVVNDAGIGTLAPDFYYALVTMHGTILVFFVLTAGLSGTFSNLLIPLQLGARDMASPMLNMFSYWFFFLAGVIMFFSLFHNLEKMLFFFMTSSLYSLVSLALILFKLSIFIVFL